MEPEHSGHNGHNAEIIDQESVQTQGSTWRVLVLRADDLSHRTCIERDGQLVAQNIGSLPEDWPGPDVPTEVQEAVHVVIERLSWG